MTPSPLRSSVAHIGSRGWPGPRHRVEQKEVGLVHAVVLVEVSRLVDVDAVVLDFSVQGYLAWAQGAEVGNSYAQARDPGAARQEA